MNFKSFQKESIKTDQAPMGSPAALMVPLLGLAGETGSLLTEYKKYLRDGEAYRLFKARIGEEIGDILWYVSNIASKAGLELSEIARENLAKTRSRWISGDADPDADPAEAQSPRLLDVKCKKTERLPRSFNIRFRERKSKDGRIRVFLSKDGKKVGDRLTDNAYFDDGYRFHDAFHLAYAAILGWSPVTRGNLGKKRKSKPQVDEVEDGGRAIVIEEGIAALVFQYAKGNSFLEGVERLDYHLLRMIKELTSHLEVRDRSISDWERAIIQGYRVWREVKHHHGGVVIGDLNKGTIEYEHATD